MEPEDAGVVCDDDVEDLLFGAMYAIHGLLDSCRTDVVVNNLWWLASFERAWIKLGLGVRADLMIVWCEMATTR